MPIVIAEALRTARKEHICDFCGQKILIGERYRNQFNVYDGAAYHWKSHTSCNELTRALKMFDDFWYDEGITAETFHEYITEYLDGQGIAYNGWVDGLAKAKQLLLSEDKKNAG